MLSFGLIDGFKDVAELHLDSDKVNASVDVACRKGIVQTCIECFRVVAINCLNNCSGDGP